MPVLRRRRCQRGAVLGEREVGQEAACLRLAVRGRGVLLQQVRRALVPTGARESLPELRHAEVRRYGAGLRCGRRVSTSADSEGESQSQDIRPAGNAMRHRTLQWCGWWTRGGDVTGPDSLRQ